MTVETTSDAIAVPRYEMPAKRAICPFVMLRLSSITSYADGITPVSRFKNSVLAQNKAKRVCLVPIFVMPSSDSTWKSDMLSTICRITSFYLSEAFEPLEADLHISSMPSEL